MNRMRLLGMRAHSDFSHNEREKLLVSIFHLGLSDQELAILQAIATLFTSAEAKRRARENESAKKKQGFRSGTRTAYLPITRTNSLKVKRPDTN